MQREFALIAGDFGQMGVITAMQIDKVSGSW